MAEDSPVRALMVYDPYVPPSRRQQAWAPTNGGLFDLAGCTTALFAGASVLLGGLALSLPALAVAFAGLAATLAVWPAQVLFIRRVYRKGT